MELFFDDNVKKLINSFSYCFNVRITIFSPDLAEKLATDFNDEKCEYCRMVGISLGREYLCVRQDREMCARSARVKENSSAPLVYTCHSGLVDTAIPIRLEGLLIGYAMVGQFRTQAEAPPEIVRAWEERGFDPAVLQSAFTRQPYFERTAMDNMLNLFSMLCTYVVSRNYIRFRRPDIAGQALRWIEDHVSEPLFIEDLAEHLGCSRSTVSHHIKRQTGLSFKGLCILKKIEAFEKIVSADPSLSIGEAAGKIGYADSFYFSRLYKKVRLMTPSAFAKLSGRALSQRALSEKAPPKGALLGGD